MLRIDRWKVQQLMKRRGIKTFQDLAARIGVAPQTLSAWFGARLGFTSESLAALCDVLKCTPNDIITIDPKAAAPVAREDELELA